MFDDKTNSRLSLESAVIVFVFRLVTVKAPVTALGCDKEICR